MITVVGGKIVDEYDEFIRTDEPLPQNIVNLTGITDDLLEKEGKNESEVAGELLDRLESGNLMIAHNAQFDLNFIYHLLIRHYSVEEIDELFASMDWIDTVTVLKDRKEFPHKLIDAVKYYELEEVNFHRAIDDTKALFEITKAMKNERNDLKDYFNLFGYNPKYRVNGKKFSFITYQRQYFHNGGMLPLSETLPNK